MTRQSTRAFAAAAGLVFATAPWAQIPSASDQCTKETTEGTPSSEFTVVGDGSVVRHEETGLEWQRCAVGQNWDGANCQGSAEGMTWQEAKKAADQYKSWRLPNINELRTIVETCRTNPAINQQVFPNTAAASFWSASPYGGDSDVASIVNFDNGKDGWQYKSGVSLVRFVRAGE